MKCPNCGAELSYDPAAARLCCDYCDSNWDPEALKETPEASAGKETPAEPVTEGRPKEHDAAEELPADREFYEADVYLCQSCGAELLVTEDTAVTFCSYCGSQNVIRSRVQSMPKPDFIIPFSRTREECEKAYRKALRRSGFAPANMRRDTTVEKFRGIYMPYWIYDLSSGGRVSVSGEKSNRVGDYIITSHYRLDSEGKASYRGISFDASSSFSDNLSRCIAPYDLTGGREFDPAYLSGYYEDMADVPVSAYRSDAQDVGRSHIAGELYRRYDYGEFGVSRADLQKQVYVDVTSEKMGLFPVWFLGCRSRDGQRISYAVVNGQTGKAAVDLPVDFGRYLLRSLVMAVPIFLLLNVFLTLTPSRALLASGVLALISLLLSSSQLDRIYTRENNLDDKGVRLGRSGQKIHVTSGGEKKSGEVMKGLRDWCGRQSLTSFMSGGVLIFVLLIQLGAEDLFNSVIMPMGIAGYVMICFGIWVIGRSAGASPKKGAGFAMPWGEKLRHLLPQILSILVIIAVTVWNPAWDLYHYGAAALSMVCVAVSFYDLVREHNRIATRVLPQMKARGGDEYELE